MTQTLCWRMSKEGLAGIHLNASCFEFGQNSFQFLQMICLVSTEMSSVCACTWSEPMNSLDIFSWKTLGPLLEPIGDHWHLHLPHGGTMVHICLTFGPSSMWQCPILRSSDMAHWKPSSFSSMSCILAIGCSFCVICLLTSWKSEMKQTI